MKKQETLEKLLFLTEYIKLSIQQDKKTHHPLKNELSKSSRRILFILNKNGPLNQRSISKILNLSPQAISESIKKLEASNLITKDLTNKNETLITLTKEGIEEVLEFKKIFINHANQLLKDFSDNDLNNLNDLIDKLTKKEINNV